MQIDRKTLVGMAVMGAMLGMGLLIGQHTGAPPDPGSSTNCEGWQCGANAAKVDNSRVNPLDLGGTYVERFHLRDTKCRSTGGYQPAKLVVQSGSFLRELSTGGFDECQQGKFTLEKLPEGKQFDIEFEYTGTVSKWGGPTLPTYLFQTVTGDELCEEGLWDSSDAAHSKTRDAVLVGGERYEAERAEVAWTDPSTASDHFNIACAGTALSKMALVNYAPAATPVIPNERQIVLRMLTARYCPTRLWNTYTKADTDLQWKRYVAGDAVPADLEAFWTADGAACISHFRRLNNELAQSESFENKLLDSVHSECGITTCASYTPTDGQWMTVAVDHISHHPVASLDPSPDGGP